MRHLCGLAAIWCLLANAASAADKLDPSKVLDEARSLATQGKYEEALQKHLWYHENALKYDPAQTGVRLSFALSYWAELGDKYPKAKEALVAVRDKTEKTIRDSKGSFDLFNEVSAINGYLKEESKTVELFKTVHEKQPDLAKKCYAVAEKDLVDRREFKLCLGYISDPLKRFDEIRDTRALRMKQVKGGWRQLEGFTERTFVAETCRLIEILVGSGRKSDAERIRERALAVQDDPAIRQAVENATRRQGDKK